ncbi:hypothetical protein C8J56DRAFT_499048 [Mycena floridula]|nr:hypothetical protein C8J56DRAFT_499048 [Mycena floridula]
MSSARYYNCPDNFQQNSATAAHWEQLQYLLRGNSYPYNSSSSKVLQLFSTVKDDLQRCNEEIEKQQLYLTSLHEQRTVLERHVRGYESLISPVRRLPPEILGQIFLLVCSANRFDWHGISIPGLILAQVCSHWRLVCFDTREIWATITIDMPNYSQGVRQAVRFLLETSDPYPISLAIDCLGYGPHARDLLGALVAESNRWSELTVGKLNVKLLVDVFPVIKSQLSSLRFLILPYLDDKIHDLNLFKVAPLLDTLDWELAPNADQPDLVVPWAQLRNLTLRGPKRPLHFLSLCPALISAELIFPTSNSAEHARDIHIKSNLSALTIRTDDVDLKHSLPLLSQLTLPSLDSLSIKMEPYTAVKQVFPVGQLRSLISRSHCTITVLSWTKIPTDFTQWTSLLQLLHSLQSLSVVDIGTVKPQVGDDLVNDAFFNLMVRPIESSFLPSLQHLSLKVAAKNAFSTPRLVRALQNRVSKGNIVRLESFKLHLTRRALGVQVLEQLKQLASAGLDMVIRDKSGLALC